MFDTKHAVKCKFDTNVTISVKWTPFSFLSDEKS